VQGDVRASAELIVGPDGRLDRMVHAAPVAWRPTAGAVYLVGTAASPVGDDDVSIRVSVAPGAALTVRSAAATVAWSGRASRQRIDVSVEEGASLDWRLEPLVATAGCDHRLEVSIRLGRASRLRWREELVLGRCGEMPGRIVTRLDAHYDGLALVRHSLEVDRRADPLDPSSSPAVLGSARAFGLELTAGAWASGAEEGAGPGWARGRLDGPGVVLQALGPDVDTVRRRMEEAVSETAGPDLS
jgi:urease accessory protein